MNELRVVRGTCKIRVMEGTKRAEVTKREYDRRGLGASVFEYDRVVVDDVEDANSKNDGKEYDKCECEEGVIAREKGKEGEGDEGKESDAGCEGCR